MPVLYTLSLLLVVITWMGALCGQVKNCESDVFCIAFKDCLFELINSQALE